MSFKFPWGTKDSHAKKDEASLDDILPTTASRIDLVLLVALCTDQMRDGLTAAFEPLVNNTQHSDTNDLLIMDDQAEEQRKDLDYLLHMELHSDQMQGLKRAFITFFNAWRTAVLRRMGEALNVRPDAVKHAKAKHVASQEAEHKAKKDHDFFAWAEGRDEDRSSPSTKDEFPYPTVYSPIVKLDEKKRALILNSCLFMLLSLENYPAHSRVLMLYLCHCFALPIDVLRSSESTLAITLINAASSSEINADEARKQKAAHDKSSRKWKVGLATVGGAVLIGVTGGLAAPLLLGVAGSIMGGLGLGGLATLLGATIANPVTVAALFGTLGGRMSGRAMDQYAKEVRDFKLIPVREAETESSTSTETSPDPARQKLRVVIGISGWLMEESDVVDPWQTLSDDACETFALQYEREALINLGSTLDQFLRHSAYGLVQAGAIELVLPALAAAMLPVSLLKGGKFLDNPFTIALERSDKAGKVLATALMAKAQGERPVTLVGYSLGARVIYSCLLELAAHNAFGLIETVVMAGSPVPGESMPWRRMRSVVAGRLINVFTTSDVLLGFLYRTRNAQLNIAGLQEIKVAGVENYNVSDFVNGHNQYRLAIGRILSEVAFGDIDVEAVEKQAMMLKAEDAMEKKVYEEAKADGQLKGTEDANGRIMMVDATKVDEENVAGPTAASVPSSVDENPPVRGMERLNVNIDSAPLFHQKADIHAADDYEVDDYDDTDDEKPHMIILDPGPEPDHEYQRR